MSSTSTAFAQDNQSGDQISLADFESLDAHSLSNDYDERGGVEASEREILSEPTIKQKRKQVSFVSDTEGREEKEGREAREGGAEDENNGSQDAENFGPWKPQHLSGRNGYNTGSPDDGPNPQSPSLQKKPQQGGSGGGGHENSVEIGRRQHSMRTRFSFPILRVSAEFVMSPLVASVIYAAFGALAVLHSPAVGTILAGVFAIVRFVGSECLIVKKKLDAISKDDSDPRVPSDGEIFRKGSEEKEKYYDEITWAEVFEYRFEHHISSSAGAKQIVLLMNTFILIVLGSMILMINDPVEYPDVYTSIWASWTFVADPGTQASSTESTRIAAAMITIGGMLIFALVIGIVSEGISERVDDLKYGSSRVAEFDHSLMLGWSDKSIAILQQIALANKSEGGGIVVVLANRDKQEMENIVRNAVSSRDNALDLLGTEVVFRQGNPLMEYDLRLVSLETARSVIVLSQQDLFPDEADSRVVRQVLAIKAYPNFLRADGIGRCHVVVELQDVDNRELIHLVAPNFAEVIVAHDIVGRLMIQCSRQPGMAHVIEAMVGFEGSEFYFEEWQELWGQTFGALACRFDEAIPMGIRQVDGEIMINPENDYVLQKGDKILVLAEDNDSYTVNDGTYKISICKRPRVSAIVSKPKERLLFCGWRRDMADMILQLDEYVPCGTELWLLNLVPAKERTELLKDKGNKEELELANLTIMNVVGNPIIRRDLHVLKAVDETNRPTGKTITLDLFDSILILADAVAIENGADMEQCDSRSLACLLIVQEIQKRMFTEHFIRPTKGSHCTSLNLCTPVSEILDTRTRGLLNVAGCKGYVMSNELISAVISQVAEEKDVNAVLSEILSAEGCEPYLKDVSEFVDITEGPTNLSFWDMAMLVQEKRAVLVGYKPFDKLFEESKSLLINPPKKSEKRWWTEGDYLVVIAFD